MKTNIPHYWSRGSSVSTGWTTGVHFPAEAVMVFFLLVTAFTRLWGPPSLLSNRYRRLLPRGQNGRDVKLTTHMHLVPR